MAIDHSGNGYLAADADILVEAFKGALKKLAVDRTNPEALVVAKRMISFAKAGERSAVRLRDLTVEAILIERGASGLGHPLADD
jgi:hypothetical protein